jgi:hypothetical protein
MPTLALLIRFEWSTLIDGVVAIDLVFTRSTPPWWRVAV